LKKYLEKHLSQIGLMGIFVFLLHSAKLNSDVVGIDTESLIFSYKDLYTGWLTIGRQGLVSLKYILGNSRFDPYFSGVMTLVMLTLAVSAFFLLWDHVKGREIKREYRMTAWISGGLLWISHPILVEQFYFSLQSMEVCIAFLLTACALSLSRMWVEGTVKKGRYLIVPGVVALLLLTFSTYQVFPVLYIFGVVTLLLLQSLEALAGEKAFSPGRFWKQAGMYAALFLAAFSLNMVITKLFFNTSDYLRQQMMWGQGEGKDNLINILHHIKNVFTGFNSVFYHWGYGLLCVSSLILLILVMSQHRKKAKSQLFILLFLYLAVMIMPFLMSVAIGGTPVIRSQLILPVMTGFLAYFNIALLQHIRFSKEKLRQCTAGFLVLICAAESIGQARVTEALYYTDSRRYEQDVAVAEHLIRRLEVVNGRWNLPVVFVGQLEFRPNNACVRGEIIGSSFFDYDTQVEPKYYWSTRRILGFLHTLGADYEPVSMERMDEALEYSTYMPMWPEDNCVQIWDDIVVVKLSDIS